MTDFDSDSGSGFGLEDILEILERRKLWILLGIVVGLGCGLATWAALPAEYTAGTTILVEPQEVPETFVKSTITIDIERRLDTLKERVTSYAKLGELIDTIGPERLDPERTLSREGLMGNLRESLEVELGSDLARSATVFQINFTNRNPAVVADVATEIARVFIEENIKDRAAQAAETADFLDKELEKLRVQVAERETEISAFKEQRMGALPSQLDTNLRTLDRLNDQLAANIDAQEGASQRVALLRSQLNVAAAAQPGGTGGPDDLSIALLAARRDLLGAQRTYTEEHPNVIALKDEVNRLEQEIRRRASLPSTEPADDAGLLNPAVSRLNVELQQALNDLALRRKQEVRLRSDIESYQARVESTPSLEQEQLSLTRDYQNLVISYQQLLEKKYEAALAKNLESAQKGERFKVLQPARTPSAQSWPIWWIFGPAGGGIGLVIAALFILVAEFRNPSFRSVNRLSRMIGLPVVASVPRIDNDRIYEEAPTGDVDPRLVVYTAPESAPAEQYRGFAPIYLEDEGNRVILVTSAQRGDGKSLTCMNLALTAACDLNRRVLLIDSDMRRPTSHRLLRQKADVGLTDVLRRKARFEDCALNSKIPNLTLLPAGKTTRNPLGLITDDSFLELLAHAKQHYDVVFIDSPPLLPVVDTRLLRRMADMVLFVVRADATPRDAVIRSMRDLKGVSGVVFNEVSAGSFRRYYYYDAYATYAYGEPTEDAAERDADG